MNEGLPSGILVHPVVHSFIEGLKEVPIGLGRDKRTVLLVEVRSRKHNHIDALSHDLVNLLEILDANFTLALENFVHKVAARHGADVPLLNVADALGMFQPGAGDQRNIAESRPTEIRQHGFVGFGPESLRLAPQISQVLVGNGSKLLQVIFEL